MSSAIANKALHRVPIYSECASWISRRLEHSGKGEQRTTMSTVRVEVDFLVITVGNGTTPAVSVAEGLVAV